MQIVCPQCQASIPAPDVELARGLAKCSACDDVFDFTGQVDPTEVPAATPALARRARVLAPRGMSDVEVQGGVAFKRRWFGARHVFTGLGGLGLTGFMLLLDSAATLWPLSAMPWAVALGLCAHAVVGLVNGTVVKVTEEGIRIAHRPVPWFGTKMLYRGAIEGVYVLERVADSQQGRRVRYEVWAKLTAGRATKVIGGLHTAHEACYIEDRLQVSLGLDHTAVTGAYQPLPGVVPTAEPMEAAGGLAIPERESGLLSEAASQDYTVDDDRD